MSVGPLGPAGGDMSADVSPGFRRSDAIGWSVTYLASVRVVCSPVLAWQAVRAGAALGCC